MDLSKIERTSQTWVLIRKYSEERIDYLRTRLERPGCPEREGDEIRGRLLELRKMLDEVRQAPTLPPVKPVDYSY